MRSYITSYSAMFTHRAPDVPAVDRIEIPLIQRDYAQGRKGGVVELIRASFLDVLHDAVTSGEEVNLDFIYGDVKTGTLRPLDGQQRLTTLFLLHWYLAFRADHGSGEYPWKRFSYATRLSARLFCERLVECQPPPAVESLSAWIEDQAWYLYTWRHDPTIQSMLVMLDAMHERFRYDDCLAAWERLVDPKKPAISFHLLPITQMGLSDDLYIKMNSRGKPLTPFENFKARFEQMLEASCPERVKEFALKVDGKWSDLLWRYHGGDFIVDDEFLRYFHFVTEICELCDGLLSEGNISSLAERVYGQSNPNAAAHLDFLFKSLDTWVDVDIPAIFSDLFATAPSVVEPRDTRKVILFGQQAGEGVDLFSACCRSYGETHGRNRLFNWSQTIFLYAVLLHRIHQTEDFARRLRILRNLVEASSNELRLEKMPIVVVDVQRIIVQGTLEGVSAFNQAQVADERLKAELLARNPALQRSLFHLEDHALLRGCLAAFELDETVFEQRASAFHRLFANPECLPSFTGALLATGDYSRPLNHRMFQLGTSSGANLLRWRELLAGTGRSHLSETRDVLGRLLDTVALAEGDLESILETIQKKSLDDTLDRDGLGWRWYIVKYPAMREGHSGIYVGSNGTLGYRICMLYKTQMNSKYRDPYLFAIYRESGLGDEVEDPWFMGYETEPRWMRLKKSGTELQCIEEGLVLRPPPHPSHAEAFLRVCADHGVGADHVLLVPQVEREGYKLDTRDRVQLGATLLRDLVKAGL
jgi:Protein of unknown function DUF262